VLAHLGELGVSSVMIEAGTRLNTTALVKGFVDRLVLFYAPRLLGEEGLSLLHSPHSLLPLPAPEVRRFGEDICVTSTLKSYWD
jgi:diaminohydroxyphosphoribosylaminopyrimidine deaminase/5-amino-6-(5-phosphoribosylamino)uracil reductase